MTISEKLTQIASNVPAVYQKGKADGIEEEYDRFWDTIQEGGRVTYYDYRFCGWTWTYANPKFAVVPSNAQGLFMSSKRLTHFDESKFDFSQVRNSYRMFWSCTALEYMPDFDLAPERFDQTFQHCRSLKTISVLDFSNCNQKINMILSGAVALESIEKIQGYISFNGFDLQDSPLLNKETFVRVINALSAETSGLAATLSKTAKEANFTDEEWAALIGTKPNWTITLV